MFYEAKFRIKGRIDGFKYYSLFKYFPKISFSKVADIDELNRLIVESFKKEIAWKDTALLIVTALKQEYNEEELKNWTICVIPASTEDKTQLRFKPFVRVLCDILSIQNGYDIISVKKGHKQTKGQSKKNALQYLNFKLENLPSRIFLFDDIINTGQSFHQCALKLKQLGVKQIVGLMLGKSVTKHKNDIFSKY